VAVEINSEKKAIELQWDPGEYDGDVTLELTGGAGDVHTTRPGPNDGYAPVTYPAEFTGSTQVRVLDADGNVIDEGSIEVA
jgi:hypothetical protein